MQKVSPGTLLTELLSDAASTKLVPALSAGVTSGLNLLVAQIAFAIFIFSGQLAPHSSQGIGLILFGNFFICLIIALKGGYRGAISGLGAAMIVTMAAIGSTIDAAGEVLFATTVVALMIGAGTAGACCLVIGYFRLSNMVRFIPYPVAGGFVAGIGGVVCLAAFPVMGVETDWQNIHLLAKPDMLLKWAPGLICGIALYLAIKRWRNPVVVPLSVVLGIVAYHIVLASVDFSLSDAQSAGLLLTSTSTTNLWSSPHHLLSDLVHVDWNIIVTQIPNLATLVVVALICVIMNIAGLEMATNQELDWDREFKVTGFASLAGALGGGTSASLIVPASFRSKLFGATTRLTGIFAACVIGSTLLLGDDFLNYVPMALIGGILIFAGLAMLDEGLIKCRQRMPWPEYTIILVIFFTTLLFGLLEGVGVGMIATLVFFAMRLSRVNVIESTFTLKERRSKSIRTIPDRAILLKESEQVHVFVLKGYIFFGSIYPLVNHLKSTLDDERGPRFLVLDFSAVHGFDFSAINVLSRFLIAAHSTDVKLVMSGMPGWLNNGFSRNLPAHEYAALKIEPNLDRALEFCEELVISAWKSLPEKARAQRTELFEKVSEDLEQYLERQIAFEELVNELGSWFNSQHHESDAALLTQSELTNENFHLLISGRASARDAAGVRTAQFGPGDVLWSVNSAERQRVSITADEPCQTMSLSLNDCRWLENNAQSLTLKLYRYLLSCRH